MDESKYDTFMWEKKPLKRALRKLYANYKNECSYEKWKVLWYVEKKVALK
jgi:hypothetical protein